MTDHRYDLFISYCIQDRPWVLSWLLPRLEEAGLVACIDYWDFEVGTPALVNMVRAVEESRQTILVLSQNWVESEWAGFEALLTQTIDPSGKQRKLIPIMLEDCELPAQLSMLTSADFRSEKRRETELERILSQLGVAERLSSVPSAHVAIKNEEPAAIRASRHPSQWILSLAVLATVVAFGYFYWSYNRDTPPEEGTRTLETGTPTMDTPQVAGARAEATPPETGTRAEAEVTGWVYIEPGSFTMGDDKGVSDHEKPAHPVQIREGFWMGKHPVTNREYHQFIDAGGYRNRRYWTDEGWAWLKSEAITEPGFFDDPDFDQDDQPVVAVSWFEATAYCAWLQEQFAANPPEWWTAELPPRVMLPSEAQWEWAAKGSENRTYPWGNDQPDETRTANYPRKLEKPSPVGAYPDGATPDGVHDMVGSVRQWCRDVWSEDAYKTRTRGVADPETTEGDPTVRALRGGAWNRSADAFKRTSARDNKDRRHRGHAVGFRCCSSVGGPSTDVDR